MDITEQYFQLSEALEKIILVESYQESKNVRELLQHADSLVLQSLNIIGEKVEWIKK